ncbi:MAG: LysR family transcriptional regulator [Ardenticatenaceae bacterium]|nr:LysR family transcriptional regulator [Ardenticatenaceae bacterium]
MLPNALTLHRLRIFLTVVEQGSFNRAAQELLLSQAAVSQHIKQLETGLGVTLFDRGARGVSVTRAGVLLVERGRFLLEQAAETESALAQYANSQSSKLVVAATAGISVHILPRWLRRFQDEFPNINLSLRTGLTRQVAERVLAGSADFGLIADGLEDLNDPRLGRQTLRQIDYLTVVPPHHPWAKKQIITAKELSQAPFVNRQPHSRTRRWLEGRLNQVSISLTTTAELDGPDMVRAAVMSGLGVSILPDYVVSKELERGSLVEVQITSVFLQRPLDLLWHNRRSFSAAQSSFARLLRSMPGTGENL